MILDDWTLQKYERNCDQTDLGNALIPSFDNLTHPNLKLQWTSTVMGWIKLFSICEGAGVVDRDSLSLLWERFACKSSKNHNLSSTRYSTVIISIFVSFKVVWSSSSPVPAQDCYQTQDYWVNLFHLPSPGEILSIWSPFLAVFADLPPVSEILTKDVKILFHPCEFRVQKCFSYQAKLWAFEWQLVFWDPDWRYKQQPA